MNEKEEKAIKYFKNYSIWRQSQGYPRARNDSEIETVLNLIQKQQKELEKKDKTINLMAEQLVGLAIYDEDKESPIILKNEQEVIKHFNQKIEKGE